MDARISIITIGVKNLDQMTKWYADIFGWKKTNEEENITFLQLQHLMLSFYPIDKLADEVPISPSAKDAQGFTMALNMRSKEEVDAAFADLKAKGANIAKAPEEVFWGGYSGYVVDPENNAWEICYNPFLALAEDRSPTGWKQ